MKKNLLMALGCIAGVATLTSCDPPKKEIAAPVAKIEPTELTKHGHTRVDNYFWMKNRDTEEVLNYLNAENDYTQSSMQETEQFQADLYDEMLGRIKQTDNSVPYLENGYYYYSRYEEGKEYPIHCRKRGSLEADEEILLNVNDMAKGYAYYQVGDYSVSSNN